MKKTTFILLSFICFGSIAFAQKNTKEITIFGKKIDPQNITPSGHIRCATTEYDAYLREQNPKMETSEVFENWMAQKIKEQKELGQVASQIGGIIYIPVVVHVIHNGDPYGVNENITDEQVQSQITVMNQDFRRMTGTPGFNNNPVGADIEIQFVLAKEDPNGNPTNGINRVNLCQASWSTTDINNTVKPQTIWNTSLYMNMWSINFSDNSLLGYATFPQSSGLNGLDAPFGTTQTDGVVANYTTFGSSDFNNGTFSLIAPYDKGRTMTHEVGHYLGLRHIWGDNNSCPLTNTNNDKDFCADTPAAKSANNNCPNGIDSCTESPGLDMIQNYMDYTTDTCMNIFTMDQKMRITTVMNNSPRRLSLKTSNKDMPIPLFANDAEIKIEKYCTEVTNSCTGNFHKVLLYNRGTTTMTSAVINYSISGVANTPIEWTGSLLPNKYAVVTFSSVQNSGNISVSIGSVNGVADERATNNTASKAFSFPAVTPPTDYPYTAYKFLLKRDSYGTETKWDLKNSSGIIVYSGGPYSGNGAGGGTIVANQNWTLAPDCYTFTIYDSGNDGICCSYGNGSWTITTNTEATTVGTGGTFTSSQSVSFTNQSLNSNGFELTDSISLYPNPTKDIVNISIPSLLGSPRNANILNSLGQNIKSIKASSNEFNFETSDLSQGIYFIQLDFETTTKTLRFIKN